MQVTQDKWQKVKELFDAALKLEPAERPPFLASTCHDAAVRTAVEKLLVYHEQAGSFLEKPWIAAPEVISQHGQVFHPDDILARRFRITGFIAAGGTGEVYEAEDLELRQQVAIKTIRKDLLGDPDVLERFRREVCFAKAITHPNMCRIFDLFRHESSRSSAEDVVFVSMELLRGETLAARLRRGRMSPAEALPTIVQMCSALDAAHTAGIVHRDLKPANVVLAVRDEPGQVRAVIMDFGIAFGSGRKFGMSLTPAGQVVGTPEWMSPEQVEGHEPTAASDVYSLGLIMYRMMTGIGAFEADSPVSSAIKRLKETPLNPSRVVAGLPPGWDAVILKCLERKPHNRFVKATEVSQALTAGAPHGLRPSRKIMAAAGAVALLLIALLATYVARARHPTSQPATTTVKWERLSLNIAPSPRHSDEFDEYQWLDVAWLGSHGWLAGADGSVGGGEGIYLGRGILLLTEDNGASWKRVPLENFQSGRGTLSCFHETWDNVSLINRVEIFRRGFPGGKTRVEGWLASLTGIYFTDDALNVNSKWRRVTPAPDSPGCYSQFFDLAQVEAFREVYAAGWQGIAHWSRGGKWEVQKSTHTYLIGRFFMTGPAGNYGWAVGETGDDVPGYKGSDRHGAIYQLDWPRSTWSRVPLPGISFNSGQFLNDIVQIDDKTVLAVGGEGLIVRGTRDAGGEWSWHTVPTPIRNSLNSIAVDETGQHIWVVGDEGTLLTSNHEGATWTIEEIKDQTNAAVRSKFLRARVCGDTLWILGYGVVLKSHRA